MNLLKLPLACLLIISAAFAIPIAGQQKRRAPEKTPAKPPAAPAPAPVTFDTLLAADSYKIYGEVRGAGQLIRSNAATEVLDPILKLGGPPKEFINFVNWLKTHSDQVMTSRMLVAAWPTLKDVPSVVVAIEMSSAEEAAKFESHLNSALLKYLPPVTPQSSSDAAKKTEQQQAPYEKPAEPPAPVPSYHLKRADSLLLISSGPVQLKKLRPAGSKLLSEDTNFRTAYNRFSSEPVFVFIDFKALEKESEERQKQYQEEQKKAEAARKELEEKQKAEAAETTETSAEFELNEMRRGALGPPSVEPPPPAEGTPKEPSQAEQLSLAVSLLQYSMFGGGPNLPDALGIGFSPDNDSFDVRALMIDSSGESDPIPLFSGLKLAGPISPESPGVLPADSQLVITLALDLPQVHALMAAPPPNVFLTSSTRPPDPASAVGQLEGPLVAIERLLKINVKDDLLPLLGPEFAISFPVTDFIQYGPLSSLAPQGQTDESQRATRMPYVLVSLRDREGMRRLMPKILEGVVGKAATSLAQTERREDTELVSYGNMVAYAFVGNFLVLSGDAATTRYVVDSYLKGETLAADVQFKNYTRWQPRLVQAQVYVSPAFGESYRTWANSPTTRISDEARAFLMARAGTAAQPITYALTNDGLGTLHELHVPKNLLLMVLGGTASRENPPETVKNERLAMSMLWTIASAEREYKEAKGSGYATLEELIANGKLSKDTMDKSGYKFEVRLTADGFEITAVPIEYGKTGKLSLFMAHQNYGIRGADHGGGPASASDPPIGW